MITTSSYCTRLPEEPFFLAAFEKLLISRFLPSLIAMTSVMRSIFHPKIGLVQQSNPTRLSLFLTDSLVFTYN